MTEPTDATPLNVIDLMRVVMDADNETRGFALRGTTNWAAHIGKAVQNAVIAKLWTPEQIAEAKERAKKFEPWLLANQEPLGAEFESVLDKHRSDLYAEATTPQPTQVQAGAVPLTEAQRQAIYDEHCYLGDNGWEVNWSDVIDAVEAAHGIKGGQHGTDA